MIHPPAPGKGWWAARIFERRRGLESFLGTASTLWRLPTGGWLSDHVGVKQLEMELVENAYDFVNESLRAARQAERRARAWKFAIVHIVQAIELLLKERLRREHPILIYENVDRKKNTVSLAQAVERITGLGVELTAKELQAVEKARRWRGLMIHYEFQVPVAEAKAVYSRLFEFATAFHSDHIGGDLHGHIEPELWPKEAELIEFFHREFVLYHGTEVHREIPRQILEAQGIVSYQRRVVRAHPLRIRDRWPLDDAGLRRLRCRHGAVASASLRHRGMPEVYPPGAVLSLCVCGGAREGSSACHLTPSHVVAHSVRSGATSFWAGVRLRCEAVSSAAPVTNAICVRTVVYIAFVTSMRGQP
jgi:hypothetical protein